MWQTVLMVILALGIQLTAGNILVRQLEGTKKPRNVRILTQAGTVPKTGEGGCCLLFKLWVTIFDVFQGRRFRVSPLLRRGHPRFSTLTCRYWELRESLMVATTICPLERTPRLLPSMMWKWSSSMRMKLNESWTKSFILTIPLFLPPRWQQRPILWSPKPLK